MTCHTCKKEFGTRSEMTAHLRQEHKHKFRKVKYNLPRLHNGGTAPHVKIQKNGATLAEVIEALKIERDSINDTIARLEAFDNAKIE